jgi:hypothetical protein
MTKQSKSVLGVILAIVLAFSAFGGTAWAADGDLTTDKWNKDSQGKYEPDFTVQTSQWNLARTVTLAAVPEETSGDPSGFATETEALSVKWAISSTNYDVQITSVDAVLAKNYNAPTGSYASQVTIVINETTLPEGAVVATISASNGTSTAQFTINVPQNTGQYLAGDAIPPTLDANCSSYLVTEPAASTEIDVTFVIEAGDAVVNIAVQPNTRFRKEIITTLSSTAAKVFTVTDLLGIIDHTNGLTFTYQPSYLSAVNYNDGSTPNGTTWEAGQWGLDGWVFRVNDKFPVQVTADGLGYEGAAIDETPIKDGDIVHFFYDYPSIVTSSIGDVAANYVRGILESYTATKLTAQLQGHKTFIDQRNNFIFNVFNYVNLTDVVTATLYGADGTTLVSVGISIGSGEVEFTGNFAPGQTYILKTDSVLRQVTGTWARRINDAYFIDTGAYSKITI